MVLVARCQGVTIPVPSIRRAQSSNTIWRLATNMPLPPAWCSSRVFTSQRGKVPIEAECRLRVICGRRGQPALMSALGQKQTFSDHLPDVRFRGQSRHQKSAFRDRSNFSPAMSAFGGKADVNHCVGECPLIAKSGHPAARPKSKIGCTENPL